VSVPAGLRKTGKFLVLTKAQDLVMHVLKITQNKKVFTPEYDKALLEDIITSTKDIYLAASEANEIWPEYERDWQDRRILQLKAIHMCERLVHLVELAKRVYHLPSRRACYLVGRVDEVQGLLKDWCSSDKKRYTGLWKQDAV
jgi:hypothetical protein